MKTNVGALFVGLWLAVCAAGGCIGMQVRPGGPGSTEWLQQASDEEFGAGAYAIATTVNQADRSGIDYQALAWGAGQHDEGDLERLLALTASDVLTGAGAQGHTAVLVLGLRRIGDPRFGRVLARLSSEVKAAVAQGLEDASTGSTEALWREHPDTRAACGR